MNAATTAGSDHELQRIEYPHIFALGGGERGFVLNSKEVMKDLLNLLFGNISGNNDGEALSLGIEVYTSTDDDDNDDDDSHDEEIGDFDAETIARAFQHLSRPASEGGPRIFIGRIKYERTVQTTPILRLVSRNVESGYHSSLGEMDGAKLFDINYSLRGDKFLHGETHEAVQFRYNMATDRAVYLFSCKRTRDFHFYMASLDAYALPPNTPLHPFCIHLILLFKLVLSRGAHLEKLIRTLIAEEEGRSGGGAQQEEGGEEQGGDGHGNVESEVFVSSTNNDNEHGQSDLDAAETERHLRRLHGLFKDLTVGENVNRREMATVECLVRDLGRLQGYVSKWRRKEKLSSNSNSKEMVATTQTESCPSPLPPVQQQQRLQMFDWLDDSSDSDSDNQDDSIIIPVDSPQSPSPSNHHQRHHRHHRHHQQRLIDSFLCLQDFCSNRALRLNTRKERTTNLINLTYNLLANRNSLSSHRIAVESAAIAHEARRDTVAMRTIAVLTMLFLPPAFISGLLGTNLIALETTGGGGGGGGFGTRIVISELWWMYFVLTVPLTGATFGVWWLVMKRLKKKRRLGIN